MAEKNPYLAPDVDGAVMPRTATTTWRLALFTSTIALVCFISALFLPAARVQDEWLDGPVANNLRTGWSLFISSSLGIIFMPALLPFLLANVCLIFCSLAMPFRPSVETLLTRLGLLLFSAGLARFETCTNGRVIGHHLWSASFLLAAVAHLFAIVDSVGGNDTKVARE